MSSGKSARLFWCGLAVVFVLALLPRVISPISRPLEWYTRSVLFWDALQAGDLAGTYQRYHPGVTTMWIAGLGLRIYAAAHGWSAGDLLDPPQASGGYNPLPVEAGAMALGAAIALAICLAYVLMVRLWGWWVGLAGGCLLALDPLYLEEGKVLHIDGMLATLVLVSVLFLLRYVQQRRWVHLVLSGMFGGLALLTKSPAACLVPWAGAAVAYRHLAGANSTPGDVLQRTWPTRIGRAARDLSLWVLVAICVFVLLWPAMWVTPERALSEMAQRAEFHIETAHRNPNFFAGRAILEDPGPLFYAATLGWKTTLVTLPALCIALVLLVQRVKSWREHALLWLVLLFAGGFALLMVIAARKEVRYLLPLFPALDVVAAWGLVQAALAANRPARFERYTWLPGVILVGALALQATDVLRSHPNYGTYYNPLLGGSRAAQHMLPLGDQGEGVDLAARFLNSYPGAERRYAGVDRRLEELSERFFVGHSVGAERPEVDYYVFTINSIQRQNGIKYWGQAWEASQGKEPLRTFSFHGVTYVWVYPAYQTDPGVLSIDQELQTQLGDHITLLGYRLNETEISAGDALTVTLFWQSDGRVTGDYHVFVHLQDADGRMVAQADGVPIQGARPTWDWRDREVLADEHTLTTDAALPAGAYVLAVGMYDLFSGVRLPVIGPDGDRLPDDRVMLQTVQVALP